ncbi:MAG: hypothetical protein ACM3JB_24910 [Acidobacteriaceae bacterium]
MKRLVSVLLPLLACSAFILTVGCGDNSSKISPPPPNISIVVSPESVILAASEVQQFTATVTGTASTAVSWSVSGCSGTNCGTISDTGLYTAPSLIPDWLVVTVRATLKSNTSLSATSAVQHRPVSVSIGDDLSLGARETHQFYALVSGHSNTAVTWSVSACTEAYCGSITPEGLYTAPDNLSGGTSARITATSKADPTKSSSVTVRHVPVIVSVSPITARIAPGGSVTLTARVRYDCSNSGMTWALATDCSEGNCGSLTDVLPDSVVYTAPPTAPSSSAVIVTATSVRDPSHKMKVAIAVGSTPALIEGDYVYFYQGWQANILGGLEIIAGRFHADGAGNITAGVRDVNTPWMLSQAEPFSGSYSVGSDGRGAITLGDATYSLILDTTGKKAQFVQASMFALDSGTGYLELQDSTAFSLSSVSGPYSVRMFGRVDTSNPVAAAGRFSIGEQGTLNAGTMDLTALTGTPHGYNNLALTGSFREPSPTTGRGTAVVTLSPKPDIADGTYNFAYYVVSKDKAVLVQIDQQNSPTIPTLGGEMRRQSGAFTPASLNAPIVFTLSGDSWFGSTLALGRMVPHGTGTMTGAIDLYDGAVSDDDPALDQQLAGTYSVDAGGRVTVALEIPARGTLNAIAYLYKPNEGFLLSTASLAQAAIGEFEPQAAGPFSTASVSGAYAVTSVPERTASWGDTYLSISSFDGVDTIVSSVLFYGYLGQYEGQSSGTYSVREDGRGVIRWTDPPPEESTVFWVVSPSRTVGVSSSVYMPVLIKSSMF